LRGRSQKLQARAFSDEVDPVHRETAARTKTRADSTDVKTALAAGTARSDAMLRFAGAAKEPTPELQK
jgi:hypothetical protein